MANVEFSAWLEGEMRARGCVEVSTALSLPRRFAYMAARKYKRMLWGEKD